MYDNHDNCDYFVHDNRFLLFSISPNTTCVHGILFYVLDEAIQDFLTSYPFLPPCLVHFMICLTGVGIVLCWLPETRKTKKLV